jgi:hypothetical protein
MHLTIVKLRPKDLKEKIIFINKESETEGKAERKETFNLN